ncbi:cytochrome P450 [Lenzites betulinus]|nr:cytochrome P450 [Lenzites betulinus]
MIDTASFLNVWTGVAGFVVLYLIAWRLHPLYHIPTVGSSSLPLLSYIGAAKFSRNAKEVLAEGYRKYPGKPFKVAMWDRWVVFISGRDLIEDVRRRPDAEMSFSESVEDTMQLKHIMDPDVMGNPFHIDTIREKLTRVLPTIMPSVVEELEQAIPHNIPGASEGWVEINVLGALQHIVARASARVFVGLPLCHDEEYLDLAVQFAIDVMKDKDTLDNFPQSMKGFVSRIYSLGRRGLRRSAEKLKPTIDQRKSMAEKWGDDWPDKPNDLLQWYIDSEHADAKLKTISDRVMVTNFAAIHTSSLSGSLSLLRLAEHPECIEPIRQEVEEVIREEGWTKAAMAKMWKLDSLLKEFQRHQGLSLASLSRRVMKDLTLRDGTFLPEGTALLATSYDIHHDGDIYENPEVFDPFRFSRMRGDSGEDRVKHQLVNTSVEYMPFGHGKHACPGRFFAANELKAMLTYIILNYDFKLGGDGRPLGPTFDGLSILPNPNATMMFKKRESKV